MRFTEMSPEDRQRVLEKSADLPLRVVFLGKTGLLTREELDFLLRHHVDFEVDDRELAEMLPRLPGAGVSPVPPQEDRSTALGWPVAFVATLLAVWSVARRLALFVLRRQV